MSPASSNHHQLIVGELFSGIHAYFHGKPCRPFVAPFNVRLPVSGTANEQIDTVVQPDISLVCKPEQLKDNHGCLGAPDWVIEALSPGTAVRDQRTKRTLYERHGVAEYWLVHPGDRSVTIYRLENGAYGKPLVFGTEDDCGPGLRRQTHSYRHHKFNILSYNLLANFSRNSHERRDIT